MIRLQELVLGTVVGTPEHHMHSPDVGMPELNAGINCYTCKGNFQRPWHQHRALCTPRQNRNQTGAFGNCRAAAYLELTLIAATTARMMDCKHTPMCRAPQKHLAHGPALSTRVHVHQEHRMLTCMHDMK